MKKFLLGKIGLVALGMAAPASAADLRARPAPPPPRMWLPFTTGAASTSAQTVAGARAAIVGISSA
jgi:hypothetical protein